MGLVRKMLYAPAMGKTYASKRNISDLLLSEIVKFSKPKSKILWLTPLRSLRHREAWDLRTNFKIPSQYVNIIPSKEEAGCNLIRKAYSPLLSLAICPKCPTKSCWYRYVLKDFLESDSGVWIATHHFLPFAVFGKVDYVIVDEYDAMIPQHLVTTVHESEVENLIKSGLLNRSVLKKLHKKRMLYKWNHIYWIPMKIFFFDVALYTKELRLLSATPPPREFDFEVTFFNPDDIPEDIIDLFNTRVKIKEEIRMPKTHKIEAYVLSEGVYMSSPKRSKMLEAAANLAGKLSGKVTIIVGSKTERERVYNIITRRYPHLKVARDTEHEYRNLENADIRIIVVGGLINRGWNLDSDYVIAFWQYMKPHEKVQLLQFLTDYYDVNEENLLKYIEYRKHVQTLFRCIRKYDKPHVLILLDHNYYWSFMIFRTLSFLRNSIHFISPNRIPRA